MLILPLLLLLCHSVFGVDIVAESVKRLQKSNPEACDNFYRHTCPEDTSENLIEKYYIKEIIEKVKKHFEEPGNQFNFINDFKKFEIKGKTRVLYDATTHLPEYNVQNLIELYRKRCDAQEDLEPLFKQFKKLFTYGGTSTSNLTLQEFVECDENHFLIEEKLVEFGKVFKNQLPISYEKYYEKYHRTPFKHSNLTAFVSIAQNLLRDSLLDMTGAKMMKTDSTIVKGIEIVAKMIEDMKEIAKDWVEETKWVQKNDAVGKIQDMIENIIMIKEFDSLIKGTDELFTRVEISYETCRAEIGSDDELSNILCLMVVYVENEFSEQRSPYILIHNASNGGSRLNIGFSVLLAAVKIEEPAGMIGFVGATVGHEIGHSLEKINANVPFFSNISSQCVFKLYEDTCKVFEEISCVNHLSQEGETVSDVFGNQLSYQIFKDHFGDRVKKMHPTLNITYEQLFFYGTTHTFCYPEKSVQPRNDDGTLNEHPAHNIRVNAIAQNPAFKTAFNCSSDSRMVKIIEEECFIYGPNAPATRRHKK